MQVSTYESEFGGFGYRIVEANIEQPFVPGEAGFVGWATEQLAQEAGEAVVLAMQPTE